MAWIRNALLLVPLALAAVLLARGLAGGKEDPSVLLARLRAEAEARGAPPPASRSTGVPGPGATPAAAISPAPDPLASLVPGPGEVPGLVSRDDLRTYTAATLYDLVNGGADLYLSRGCRGAVSALLVFATGEEVSLEAFELAGPAEADSVWREDTGGPEPNRGIGAGGHADAVSLRFRKGSVFVRLTSVPATGRTEKILEDTARAVAGRIP